MFEPFLSQRILQGGRFYDTCERLSVEMKFNQAQQYWFNNKLTNLGPVQRNIDDDKS